KSIVPGWNNNYFTGATNKLVPRQGDVLSTYVLVDPCNPPRELMLQYHDGSRWLAVFWGENLMAAGTTLTRIGPLPETGKWIRLEVPASLIGVENVALSGMSFDIYDGRAWFDRPGIIPRVNLAFNKPATQSSNLNNDPVNFGAQKAVDGNTDGNYGVSNSITHTSNETNAWWQVDLGSVQPIENIVLWNRTDCCTQRLSNFYLFVSDDPFTSTSIATTLAQPGVSAYHVQNTVPTSLTFSINRTGRYVRVQQIFPEYFTLAEVQVWAPASLQRVN